MKSKTLLLLAAQAFQAKDFKKSGALFASAMNQTDAKFLIRELQSTNSSMVTESNVLGINNELFKDRDLPLGDNRTTFLERLSDKYPQVVIQPFDPNNEPIHLLPANEGSLMPTSGGQLEESQDEEDDEIDEELAEDPTVSPSSISEVSEHEEEVIEHDFNSVSSNGRSGKKPQRKNHKQVVKDPVKTKFQKVIF